MDIEELKPTDREASLAPQDDDRKPESCDDVETLLDDQNTENLECESAQGEGFDAQNHEIEDISDSLENGAEPCEQVAEPINEAEQGDGKKKRRRKRRKISDITFANDIRYRGPFSYRWLRIFAWVCIIAAQASIILNLGIKLDANLAKNFTGLTAFLQFLGTLSVPLFLMANFAIIINAKNGYFKLIGAYVFMSLIIFSLFALVYQRYLLGIMNMLVGEEGVSSTETFQGIFQLFSSSGFLAFNIFIDLLLCTLFTFFINYNPKKVFVGKKVIIFRLFALLPVAYEVVSFTLKLLCVMKPGFTLPLYVSPFLTTKPPLTFMVFVMMAFFIKNRERLFIKRGKTQEEYGEFLKTNINSLHFSIATSVCMLVTAIIDIILYVILSYALGQHLSGGVDATESLESASAVLMSGASVAGELGFGKSVTLVAVIPFIMLFSYTRTHKPSSIDMIIPIFGIVGFVICYVEGFYQFILRLPTLIQGMFGD